MIEEYYIPRNLTRAIHDIGHIPADSCESQVGVGFIDVADYTHLSRFLSPKENQALLNGLYTAFQIVLERHGGFLNKIEGDSMMFQFDDVIDKRLWDLDRNERITRIARELFYTCIEMQRACILFNQADDGFLDETATPTARKALASAFGIIKELRSKNDVASTLFAFFQIRIRIGANIGEVTIGNFGPDGAKHWDIIGFPVISAKRMESTAPVGGLRISADFFHILDQSGIAEDYYRQFKAEAEKLGGVYRNIDREDLFRYREVVIHQKRDAVYRTYSVQVYPGLPESLCAQAEELLNHGSQGTAQIIEFFRYYRANHFVIDSLEKTLESRGVVFRKNGMLDLVFSKLPASKKPTGPMSLFRILGIMDRYLDFVQKEPEEISRPDFLGYDQFMTSLTQNTIDFFEKQKSILYHKTWFSQVIVPLVYANLEASLREYQISQEENVEVLQELDDEAEPKRA